MPLDIKRIQALCFDVDGTLRDTDDQYMLRFARWLRPFRFLFPDRDTNKPARWLVTTAETPANFIFGLPDRFGIDDELAAVGDWLHRKGLLKAHKEFMIIPGTIESLTALGQHYPQAVVTARGQRGTLAFLEHYQLSSHFQAIATAQTAKRTKPKPDPILWAAARTGVPPENCLMIGDTTVDIQAGKAAGAQTVGVLCGFGEAAELKRAGADLILPSIAELPALLLD